MISYKRLEEQLRRINFHYKGWGRTEVNELCNILMPEEEIEECVNGYYEAGFALMVATKDRVLLVDKKPLGYLTVEDMRFDMINELDLHHRLMGAQVRISAGNKTLHFTSLNQVRLRRLLNYVQTRMTQIKRDAADRETAQKQHLEEMNEQLRLYLLAAHKQQYMDQANLISQQGIPGNYNLPPMRPPAALLYDQPAEPQAEPRPASPFEQVASAAFDAQDVPGQPLPAAPVLNSAAQEGRPAAQQPAAANAPERSTTFTPQQIGLAAARRVVPIISAYTRLPLLSQRRRSAGTGSRGTTPEAA